MVSTTAISGSQQEYYNEVDVDDDGYISKEEWEGTVGEGEEAKDANGYTFEDYDADGDGKISQQEYKDKILEDNKAMAKNIWSMAMKMFKLDQYKPPDLGIPNYRDSY